MEPAGADGGIVDQHPPIRTLTRQTASGVKRGRGGQGDAERVAHRCQRRALQTETPGQAAQVHGIGGAALEVQPGPAHPHRQGQRCSNRHGPGLGRILHPGQRVRGGQRQGQWQASVLPGAGQAQHRAGQRRRCGGSRSAGGMRRHAARPRAHHIAQLAVGQGQLRPQLQLAQGIEQMHLALLDAQLPHHRQRERRRSRVRWRRVRIDLPGHPTVGLTFQFGVQRIGLQTLDAQGLAVPSTPEVGIPQLQLQRLGPHQERLVGPGRRGDLHLGRKKPDAAQEPHRERTLHHRTRRHALARSRRSGGRRAQADLSLQALRQGVLKWRLQHRPAQPLAQPQPGQRGQQQRQCSPAPDCTAPGWRRCGWRGVRRGVRRDGRRDGWRGRRWQGW